MMLINKNNEKRLLLLSALLFATIRLFFPLYFVTPDTYTYMCSSLHLGDEHISLKHRFNLYVWLNHTLVTLFGTGAGRGAIVKKVALAFKGLQISVAIFLGLAFVFMYYIIRELNVKPGTALMLSFALMILPPMNLTTNLIEEAMALPLAIWFLLAFLRREKAFVFMLGLLLVMTKLTTLGLVLSAYALLALEVVKGKRSLLGRWLKGKFFGRAHSTPSLSYWVLTASLFLLGCLAAVAAVNPLRLFPLITSFPLKAWALQIVGFLLYITLLTSGFNIPNVREVFNERMSAAHFSLTTTSVQRDRLLVLGIGALAFMLPVYLVRIPYPEFITVGIYSRYLDLAALPLYVLGYSRLPSKKSFVLFLIAGFLAGMGLMNFDPSAAPVILEVLPFSSFLPAVVALWLLLSTYKLKSNALLRLTQAAIVAALLIPFNPLIEVHHTSIGVASSKDLAYACHLLGYNVSAASLTTIHPSLNTLAQSNTALGKTGIMAADNLRVVETKRLVPINATVVNICLFRKLWIKVDNKKIWLEPREKLPLKNVKPINVTFELIPPITCNPLVPYVGRVGAAVVANNGN